MTPVEREVGLVDPPRAELAGDERDRLRPAVRQHDAARVDADGGGEGAGRGLRGRVARRTRRGGRATSSAHVGRERVQAHRQVEHRRRVDAQRRCDGVAVAAVRPGRRHRHRRLLSRRRRSHRSTDGTTSNATSAPVTSRDSCTAARMSSAPRACARRRGRAGARPGRRSGSRRRGEGRARRRRRPRRRRRWATDARARHRARTARTRPAARGRTATTRPAVTRAGTKPAMSSRRALAQPKCS